MQTFCALLILAFTLSPFGSAVPQNGASAPTLDAVIQKMDSAATSFRTTRADFEWDRYEKVIDEVDDIQSGTIYFRRTGKDVDMKLDITKPDLKYVLFSDGKFRVYQPKPDQVTLYDAGKNRAD